VDVKSDGDLALKAALANTYDLILLDGMMPKLTGLQVAEALITSGQDIAPIIFLSAKNQAKDIQEFLKFGIGYIPKPFDPQSMCNMIAIELKL
jgi:DNA-binding response OmpR family regulator